MGRRMEANKKKKIVCEGAAGPGAAGIGLAVLLVTSLVPSTAAEDCQIGTSGETDFYLNITCSPTHIEATLHSSGNSECLFTANVFCRYPNGTEQHHDFLSDSDISGPTPTPILHEYPVGTECSVNGSYRHFFHFSSQQLPAASCTISQPTSTIISTPAVFSSSSTVSPQISTSHLPPSASFLSHSHLPSRANPTTTATTTSSSLSLSSSTSFQLGDMEENGVSSPFLASITVFAVILSSLILLCLLLLLAICWHRSHNNHRKLISVGANNWKTEVIELDYHPVDLRRPLAPHFSSRESLIASLCTLDSSPHHPLAPAPLPPTTHPVPPPTESGSDRQTHHSSFLHPVVVVREGGEGETGGGKADSIGDTVGAGEETSGGVSSGCTGGVSSGCSTSGYSTRCSSSDSGHLDTHALIEVHATFQPEKRQASDTPAPSTSVGPQQVLDVSSDSSATQGADLSDCNEIKTENESSTVPPVPKIDIGVVVDSKPSTLEEPVVTDNADEGSSVHSVDPSWNSCTMPVACSTPCSANGNNSREGSNTASSNLTASSGEESTSASTSPTIGSRQESTSSSPTAVSSREEQMTECQEVTKTTTEMQTNSQEANPKPCIDDTASFKDSAARVTSETDIPPPTLTVLEQQKAELLIADAPPTPTASEQRRAELLFSYLQRTSAAGSVHQQSSCSSPSSVNGSGSLLDYAGYLHI